MHEAGSVILAAAGVLTLLASAAGVLWWLVKPRLQAWAREQILEPLHETRRQVSENHHSNETPTVLDRIDDVHREVEAVNDRVNKLTDAFHNHLLLAASENAQLLRTMEAVARAEPPADL